ncbi:MAG: succinate dehydrogenase, cytochrome b556 subunit [Gammaproteobacteria bacterium]
MELNSRPLSPHLQIYRLPLTGIISISHRATGVFLALGLTVFATSLVLIASGQAAYDEMQKWLSFLPVRLIVWAFVFSMFFHLCHGIRHLIWDTGTGFERADMNKFAYIELGAAVLLTTFASLMGV